MAPVTSRSPQGLVASPCPTERYSRHMPKRRGRAPRGVSLAGVVVVLGALAVSASGASARLSAPTSPTGAYQLYCPDPVETPIVLHVRAKAVISPANPALGNQFHVSKFQTDVTFPQGIASALAAMSPITGKVTGTACPARGARAARRARGPPRRPGVPPVFQSIVDLETGETLGYEALTRFDSGQRPDLCFADAWSVGLGIELELATLEAAVDAAKELPAGTWLDLNVSPRLLADPGRLREILGSADRALVLEVTEHELIGDYDALRRAVRDLGPDIRLAVDDAGAGVANFGHIIDLRPDYVKLDISLVRRVNANIGRQAMVVGMRHFSRTAGCRLIAEGIETEDEGAHPARPRGRVRAGLPLRAPGAGRRLDGGTRRRRGAEPARASAPPGRGIDRRPGMTRA